VDNIMTYLFELKLCARWWGLTFYCGCAKMEGWDENPWVFGGMMSVNMASLVLKLLK